MTMKLNGPQSRSVCFRAPATFNHVAFAKRVQISACTVKRHAAFAVVLDSTDALAFPYKDRDSVLSAMERLDFRATAAEVAASAGMTLFDAERTLQWLIYESKGSMKV
jgi:hypothetical protein